MKTIVLTITRGSTAYNLLSNDFYRTIREKFKVVIFTTAWQDERFVREFAHPNVSFVPYEERQPGALERFLFFFHKHLIYNSTVNQKARWGIIGDPKSKHASYPAYLLRRAIFVTLSKFRFLRDVVRFLDYVFTQRDEVRFFEALLREHHADCVVSTFVSGDSEAALIKAAKRQGVLTVGLPKSWDNLSKHGLRAKPELLVVWNEFSKEQAMEFDNYKAHEIKIIGVPQFDRYVDKDRIVSREAFCAQYGLDPSRKIIMFGSEGKLFPSDAEIANIIADLIGAEALGHPSQLLIRPHYGYRDDEKKFASALGKPHVAIDLLNNPSKDLRDRWDYSEAFADRFVNCLYHADVLVNTASTLTLDAICFDTPVINIAFDGYETLPYEKSIERWYETYYYRRILSYRATAYVKSKEALAESIGRYLDAPETHRHERMVLRDDFCYKLDGRAGERFAQIIESLLLS